LFLLTFHLYEPTSRGGYFPRVVSVLSNIFSSRPTIRNFSRCGKLADVQNPLRSNLVTAQESMQSRTSQAHYRLLLFLFFVCLSLPEFTSPLSLPIPMSCQRPLTPHAPHRVVVLEHLLRTPRPPASFPASHPVRCPRNFYTPFPSPEGFDANAQFRNASSLPRKEMVFITQTAHCSPDLFHVALLQFVSYCPPFSKKHSSQLAIEVHSFTILVSFEFRVEVRWSSS